MRVVVPVAVLSLAFVVAAHAADPKVESLKEGPTGLSPAVTAALSETALRVSGPNGPVCDVWLTKEVPLNPNFKSSLQIKYPFQPGQLIGAIRFPARSTPTDFRGQELKPGIYTLRYGLQPSDGNHVGTSEIRDFLVACPPKEDADPKPIEDFKALAKLSAAAPGTAHPAIFPLLEPADKPVAAPAAKHDAEKDLLILETNASGKAGAAAAPTPIRLVVFGKGEG